MPRQEWNSEGEIAGYRVAGVRERVIARLSAALAELSRDDTPVEWALIQKSLGAAHLEVEGSERPEAIEFAIGCFEASLAVVTSQPDFHEMSAISGELATAYRARVAGNRADNLERAMHYLERSFETGVQTEDARFGVSDKQSAWDAL
jgi:hypothetical protein